jgi:hypothetical protein
MNWLHDERIDCFSAMEALPIRNYLMLVKDAHEKRGRIGGQRDVLKTTTGKRIRDRMIADIRAGAVLPPVVVGIVDAPSSVQEIVAAKEMSVEDFIRGLRGESLSIIDGMQRTEALLEASEIDNGILSGQIRVDFWLAKSVRALVYRMLVLNTGQVPWTLARQLSVIYAPLLSEIKNNVPSIARIITPDKPGRRVSGGEFSSEALIELFMAFSLRKTNIDTRENLSEEFSRLDLVANVADENVQGYFYQTLSTMAGLDIAFDRLDVASQGRFARGRDIFSSQPARIGYIVAVSQHVLGKIGLEKSPEERAARMDALVKDAKQLTEKLAASSADELRNFLRLDVLSEILDRKVGQVGRYERAVFFEAFKLLIEERFAVPDMEPCWRAN